MVLYHTKIKLYHILYYSVIDFVLLVEHMYVLQNSWSSEL